VLLAAVGACIVYARKGKAGAKKKLTGAGEQTTSNPAAHMKMGAAV